MKNHYDKFYALHQLSVNILKACFQSLAQTYKLKLNVINTPDVKKAEHRKIDAF